MTARKILQNAIWGLRRALLPNQDESTPVALRTQSPGYSLDVPPEHIDLHLFHRWVKEGRSRLEAGEPDEAGRLLNDALELWRGPALLDVTEAGLSWPELSTLESTRLDVLEDFFEAQLACGRHQAVLGDLESMVENEPLRERACGQLMRALYRCGRQSDALGVFSRLRNLLVEDFGLEPSRELQQLQQAILNHDPDLALVLGGDHPRSRPVASLAAEETPARPRAEEHVQAGGFPALTQPQAQGAWPTPQRAAAAPLRAVAAAAPLLASAPKVLSAVYATTRTAEALALSPGAGPLQTAMPANPSPPRPAAVTATGSTASSAVRRRASILAVRAEPDPVPEDCAELDAWTDRMSGLVQREIEQHGGVVISSLGDATVALFAAEEDDEEYSLGAVLAAYGLRAVLTAPPRASGDGAAAGVRTKLRVSVATGEVLVSQSLGASSPPKVFGARVMNESGALLDLAPSDRVQVCDRTREETQGHFSYAEIPGTPGPPGAPARWQLLGRVEPARGDAAEEEDNSHLRELDLLQGAMTHSSRWSQPHLITVLGNVEERRSRMLHELEIFATETLDGAQVLTWSREEAADSGPFGLHRRIISQYSGVVDSDPPWAVRRKISAIVDRLDAAKSCSNWLVARCTSLFETVNRTTEWLTAQEWMDVWRYFLEAAAQDGPLVLIVDDLHLADQPGKELVGLLARLPDMIPLTVIVGATPELVRHPDWSSDRRLATIVMLDRPDESELACSTA
ncbi:BTAD domain-containing putative transcriptional regulator [Streptomyces sp. NPDC001928]|uniref:BTAD domain-containing putative transcriptional regulator n=1 Tax=Streptomyces sp. NPDC001928 TaxID=3154404 RepID=UPI00331B8DF7